MTAALFILGTALGWLLRSFTRIPPAVVTLERAPSEWVHLGGPFDLRERLAYSPSHVRSVVDRLAAVERERSTLIDLLREYRQEEFAADRALRLVRGGGVRREGSTVDRAALPLDDVTLPKVGS